MKNKLLVVGMWTGLFVLSLALIACGDQVMASQLSLDSAAGGLVMLGFAGLIVDKATIANVFISLKTTFQNAFDAAPSVWEKIAMKVPSTSSKNDYSWLSNFPKMRRWVGEKYVKSLKAYNYSVINEDWEATIEVKRNDIKDDQLAGYAVQAQSAGQSAKQLPDEIVIELVNGGFTALCYDGQYFFDTDHDVAGASVSNKLTVALSAATFAAAKASYGAARVAMGKFKDDEGRPLNVTTSVLLVPKALEDDANLLMTAATFEDGKPNIYRGTAEVVCDARLTSDTAWFLLDTTKPVKPFIYQERQAPEFVEQTGMDSDDVFNKGLFKMGAEARAAGGYGFWQMAVGSTGAG